MDLGGLFDRFLDMVQGCSAVEMNRHRMLARRNVDYRRGGRKEKPVLCKVADAEGGRHYDQAQRFYAVPFVLPHLLSQLQDTAKYTDEYVRIHTSFVSFVDDDD